MYTIVLTACLSIAGGQADCVQLHSIEQFRKQEECIAAMESAIEGLRVEYDVIYAVGQCLTRI